MNRMQQMLAEHASRSDTQQRPASLSVAGHNALMTVVSMYGEFLADQERTIAMLKAQVASEQSQLASIMARLDAEQERFKKALAEIEDLRSRQGQGQI